MSNDSASRRPSNTGSASNTSPKYKYPSTSVDFDSMHFLIIDAPTDHYMRAYITELKYNDVTHLVRTCDPSYDGTKIQDAGIHVHELFFPDGDAPPKKVVTDWMQLVAEVFGPGASRKRVPSVAENSRRHSNSSANAPPANKAPSGPQRIAVHCQAGLGRAPALVAIALMESGLPPLDAVKYIRDRRKGAFNAKQLAYLEAYKPSTKNSSCRIM